MTATAGRPQFSIARMGAVAHVHLVPGQQGRTLAVLSDVAYLLTASGEVLWLASDSAFMHRRCVQVSGPFPRPAAGAPFRVVDQCLTIEPGLALDAAAASMWQPQQVNRNDLLQVNEIPARIRALAAKLDFGQARGFGCFIPGMLGGAPASAVAGDDLVLEHARPIILGIADACRRRDMKQIAHGADALIGLGGGLTPSGDDLVGGLLFGIEALRVAYRGVNSCVLPIASESYRTRTHVISFTLLNDLAKGHAIAPLHDIVNGILGGGSLESIHLAILRLTQVGHSTGWDVLAGLLAALLSTES